MENEKDITSVHVKMHEVVRMHAIYSNDNKGVVTPISKILRAATRLLTHIWQIQVWLMFLYSTKKIHVCEFLPQSQAHQQFGIMATRSHLGYDPSYKSKYGAYCSEHPQRL